MHYDDIRKVITSSSPADWAVIAEGPLYLDWLGEAFSGEQRWVDIKSHEYLAVYKADVNVRLAWGMEIASNLSFEGWTWPDKDISRFLVDVFWQGALVNRWACLHVDGGRSYLPDPNRLSVDTGDSSAHGNERVAWTAPEAEIALARLLQDLTQRPRGQFDRYLEQSGIVQVPG